MQQNSAADFLQQLQQPSPLTTTAAAHQLAARSAFFSVTQVSVMLYLTHKVMNGTEL